MKEKNSGRAGNSPTLAREKTLFNGWTGCMILSALLEFLQNILDRVFILILDREKAGCREVE